MQRPDLTSPHPSASHTCLTIEICCGICHTYRFQGPVPDLQNLPLHGLGHPGDSYDKTRSGSSSLHILAQVRVTVHRQSATAERHTECGCEGFSMMCPQLVLIRRHSLERRMIYVNAADILERYTYGAGLPRLWADTLIRGQFTRNRERLMTTWRPGLLLSLWHWVLLDCNSLGHGYPLAHPVLGPSAVTTLSWNFLSFVAHWIEFPTTVSPERKWTRYDSWQL